MTADEAHRLTKPERKSGTSSERDWSAWNAWCDSRIELKLVSERKRIRDIMTEIVAQLIAKETKPAQRSISKRRAQGSQHAK
jgi:hypothetical protein